MPKYTHKERPISEISESAPIGVQELINTGKLPSDEEHKKTTLSFIKKYTIDQGDLYTSTFKDLTFREQANSLNADLAMNLHQAIRAHVLKAEADSPTRDPKVTLQKCIDLVEDLKSKLVADPQLKKYE